MSSQTNKRSHEDASSDSSKKDEDNSKKLKNNKEKVKDENEEESSLNDNISEEDEVEEGEEFNEEFDEENDEENDEEEEEEDYEGYEEEGEEEESENEQNEKEISVEFTAHDPDENDFHGIKCLLQQLWLKENICYSELTDLIINDTISTVLKQETEDDNEEDDEDEDTVYGVISIIPFNDHFNEKQSIKQIKEVLKSYLPEDHEIHKKIKDNKQICALVINERFVNLPPKISVPCYQQMLTELTEYKDTKGTDNSESVSSKEDSSKYDFDYVIMICKLSKYRNEVLYSNGEDEIFSERAEYKYEYSVANQSDYNAVTWNANDEPFEPFRKILMLSKEKWIRTINTLQHVV